MFKCEVGNHQIGPGQSPTKLVLQTRPRTYETKLKVRINERMIEKTVTSSGWEIVREVNSCQNCLPKEPTNG